MPALLTHSHRSTEDFPFGFSPPPGLDGVSSLMPMSAGVTVYVAVGNSVAKTAALLRWTFSVFPGEEVCLLHIHRPSPLIPTLLGKLPASRANPEIIAAFRNEEREETMKLLSTYLLTCSRSRVKASIITAEADEVQKGIVDLVNLHTIRKLVVGPIPDFMKGKKRSCKACYVSKYAPPYCEMWFVYKGKMVWTRQASTSSSICLPSCQSATAYAHNPLSPSLNFGQNEETEASQTVIGIPTSSQFVENSSSPLHSHSVSSSTRLRSCNKYATSTSSAKTEEEGLSIQVSELKCEVNELIDEAYLKFQEQKQFEVEALEAFIKVKALESAHSHEVKLRIDAEDALRITIEEHEKLFDKREKVTRQLQQTMRNIAVLDSRAQEANRRCDEVGGELKLIQASVATLRKEKQQLQRQKMEATRWLDRWRCPEQCEGANKTEHIGSIRDVSELPEFSSSELETGTCNFSESFRIGQGGYGIVYKGEILERTVAVKKLHLSYMQRQSRFHSEVQNLGKVHHPHLVELIGVCPESWSLVYEYLPGGSLQKHLSNHDDSKALNWKTRARIVADIASGLLYLHSFGAKKIVHGNLKPENLLLDSANRCKISDYADHMLTAGLTIRCPSFHGYPGSNGVCLYTDPDMYRSGAPSHKSDIYSFGVIVLQLVTGKTDRSIVAEVSRAFCSGKVASILDSSGGEWPTYVARRLMELALQCCELNRRDRPELTPSLIKELYCLPFLEEQSVPSFFLCPILREIMHNPQVAADGFTYEGDAMRGWLEDGHETSPMTNLKLNDLNLTPNHSLRLAIQDWVANLKITA